MGVQSPSGIIALAIILMIVAMLGIIGGTVLATVIIPPLYNNLSLQYTMAYLVGSFEPMGGASIGLNAADFKYGVNFLTLVAWIGFIFGGVSLPTSIGLLSMKKWGRYLAIITGVLIIIVGIFIILVTLGIFPELMITNDIEEQILPILLGLGVSVVGIVVVVYLVGDVKYNFE